MEKKIELGYILGILFFQNTGQLLDLKTTRIVPKP